VVIDEIQRRPDLFPTLRTLVDREERPARFLVLGSASRDLIRQGSESLAGRISYLEVTPFSLYEIPPENAEALWIRGGFPPSFLARSTEDSLRWREDFVRTFLERDIPSLGITLPPEQLRRFWLMLVHYHGQVFNASELGRSLGVAYTTASRYLDILAGTFMVRRLPPWHENIRKRQIKRPKIYLRDSGLLHALLGLGDKDQLLVHPKLGASWEGFALEEILRLHRAEEGECFFWGVHEQCELDLFLLKRGKRLGFEVKYSGAPKLTASLLKSKELLQLDEATIVCPGDHEYSLAKDVRVKGLSRLVSDAGMQRADSLRP